MYVNARLLNPRFKSQDKSYLINDLNEDIRNAVDKHLDKFIKKTGLLEEIKLQMEKRTQLKAFEDAQKGLKKASRMNIPKLMPPTGNKATLEECCLLQKEILQSQVFVQQEILNCTVCFL